MQLERNKNRILFGEKRIFLGNVPRTGFCEMCENNIFDQSCTRTAIHHFQYDETDPLAHTIELCAACHTSIGIRGGQLIDIGKWIKSITPKRVCNLCHNEESKSSLRMGGIYEEWRRIGKDYYCIECYNELTWGYLH